MINIVEKGRRILQKHLELFVTRGGMCGMIVFSIYVSKLQILTVVFHLAKVCVLINVVSTNIYDNAWKRVEYLCVSAKLRKNKNEKFFSDKNKSKLHFSWYPHFALYLFTRHFFHKHWYLYDYVKQINCLTASDWSISWVFSSMIVGSCVYVVLLIQRVGVWIVAWVSGRANACLLQACSIREWWIALPVSMGFLHVSPPHPH